MIGRHHQGVVAHAPTAPRHRRHARAAAATLSHRAPPSSTPSCPSASGCWRRVPGPAAARVPSVVAEQRRLHPRAARSTCRSACRRAPWRRAQVTGSDSSSAIAAQVVPIAELIWCSPCGKPGLEIRRAGQVLFVEACLDQPRAVRRAAARAGTRDLAAPTDAAGEAAGTLQRHQRLAGRVGVASPGAAAAPSRHRARCVATSRSTSGSSVAGEAPATTGPAAGTCGPRCRAGDSPAATARARSTAARPLGVPSTPAGIAGSRGQTRPCR